MSSTDRILVLETDAADGLPRLLGEAGLRGEETTPAEIFEQLSTLPQPALLLCARCDTSVLELCQRLRGEHSLRELLIVGLLDESDDEPAGSPGQPALALWQSALQAGVDLCLPRSLPLPLLVAQLEVLLRRRATLLADRNAQERAEHLLRHLARTQRLATIGQLAAGLAHELSNPLTYLLHDLGVLDERLPTLARAAALKRAPTAPQLEEAATQLRSAREAAQRIHDVVRDLRGFIEAGDEVAAVAINDLLDGALNLVFGEIRFRARLVKNYRTLPTVRVSRGSLGQLLLELLLDAARVADTADGGEVGVRTQGGSDGVRIEISGRGRRLEPVGPERLAVYQQLVEVCRGALSIEREATTLTYVVELVV